MKKRQPLEVATAYMLAGIPAMFGIAGVHRFYMRRIPTGLLYLFTWGLFGFGTLHDFIVMPRLVERYNNSLSGNADQPHQVVQQQVVRRVVKVRCRYCGALNDPANDRCDSCGGSL